jgi:predicted DNA-binding ribbon-helix-helix protein
LIHPLTLVKWFDLFMMALVNLNYSKENIQNLGSLLRVFLLTSYKDQAEKNYFESQIS